MRKVSALVVISGGFIYPASLWSVSLLRAMMEIRALSPPHSSGLFGLEPLELERSRRYYDAAALRPLGIVRTLDFEHRGSDYGTMTGQLGVEFTITLEPENVSRLRLFSCA